MTTLIMSPTLGDLLKFELNGSYSRETVTLKSGTSYALGSVLGKITASVKYTEFNTANADGSQTAKRLVVVFSPNGTIHSHWRPQGSGASFTFPAGSILEPLQKHKSKLLICDGIDYKSVENHESGMAASNPMT